ncbi:nuclear transport factor 2 family protein [Herbiconiux liangxiaofengii]|uniref:nuclear transport factor 2 family protein n=1 Tax=Herbiconiux liangxiaofengii TaxID=3342795 RepID=UPI0035B6B037
MRTAIVVVAMGAIVVGTLAGCAGSSAATQATSAATTGTTTTDATGTDATSSATPDRSDSATEEQNKAIVLKLLAAGFPDPSDPAAVSAAAESVSATATTTGSDQTGPEALLQRFAAIHTRVPNAQPVVKHSGADGDLVAVHWQATGAASDEFSGEAEVDLFRLDGGRIVQFWSFSQTVPSTTASGNSMFSDLFSSPAVPSTEAEEEQQRQLAVGGYDTLFRDQDASVLDRLWSPDYLQHNPLAGNGTAVLKQFLANASGFPPMESAVSLADGDLVWTFAGSSGEQGALTVADIFRVADGKIVEHWDVVPTAG